MYGAKDILTAIQHLRQNTAEEDQYKVDAWLAGFLAAIGRAVGRDGVAMAAELNRYVRTHQERE